MSIASQSPPVAARAQSSAPPARAASRPTSLDHLAGLGPTVLQSLYEGARTPVLEAMDGPLVGRMLAVPVLPRWMAGLLRWFAAWSRFPWRGKTFTARGDGKGEGINRVFGERNPRRWFRFDTFVAPSRAGAFDAVQLDYDNPGNPGLIRAIKDEVREVAPGLYLGIAYLMWRGRPRLMLYFGLRRP
ncbi:MAG TPA: hypothetical protein VMT47_17960 [Polyangia bacterium]|nr:hypothetical protein [Polyangia bacterium]